LRISKKGVWLTNPLLDIFFLTGLFTLAAMLMMEYSSQGSLPKIILRVLLRFSIPISSLHFFATFLFVYLERNEQRERIFRYLCISLLLVFIYTILRVTGRSDLTASILFYFIIGHIIFQAYFIMQAYNFTQIRYPKIDTVINSAALLLGPVFCFLSACGIVKFHYGGKVLGGPLNPFFLKGFGFLAFFSLAAFITRQLYQYIKWKKIALFNILMILTINIIFYLALFVFRGEKFVIIGVFRYYHGLQYLVWLVLYIQIKAAEYRLKKVAPPPDFHWPLRTSLLFGFFLFISFIGVIPWSSKRIFFGAFVVDYAHYYSVIFHNVLDFFLWCNMLRIKKMVTLAKQVDSNYYPVQAGS